MNDHEKYKERYMRLKKINKLTPDQINNIKKDIYYLNISELSDFCNNHKIPYVIYEEIAGDSNKKTSHIDRKEIVIKKILKYIIGDKVDKSIIPLNVINKKPLINITEETPVYYGQYNNANKNLLAFLKSMTDNKFKFGAIAQKILWDNWLIGNLLTYRRFAELWINETKKHIGPIPEWAYLTDLHNKNVNRAEWKKYRQDKAKKIVNLLNLI